MRSFVLYRDATGAYRWRIVGVNGLFLADSGQGYSNKRDALHGAFLTFQILEGERAAGILKGVQ